MKTQKQALIYLILAVVVFVLSGCGGGSSAATSTVSGVASSGAPMTGTVFLRDSANNLEMSTTINPQTGAFSFNVVGKTAPFLLRSGTLYSMSSGPGTANINPLTHLMVADAGDFADMSSMNAFFNAPNGTTMNTISGKIAAARLQMQQTMAPLLSAYGVATVDPITGSIVIGKGMDRMFDDVKMAIDASGMVTMMYANGTSVYSGPMATMSTGIMIPGNIVTPTVTPIPSGVSISPSVVKMQMNAQQQFTASISVTWSVVTANGGSITSGGLYTGPNVQGMFLVKATSVADPTKSATATVQMGSSGMMM